MAKKEYWIRVSATKTRCPSEPWVLGIPKISAGKPRCGPCEVAFKITLNIPGSYFELPEMTATITLPEAREKTPEARAELQQRMADQLKESLGVNVTFVEHPSLSKGETNA